MNNNDALLAYVLRLGDGTEESHARVQQSVVTLWQFTGELFAADEIDATFAAEFNGPDLEAIRAAWRGNIAAIFEQATLIVPDDGWMASGGKQGRHSEHFGYLIAEMQFLQRRYPGAEW